MNAGPHLAFGAACGLVLTGRWSAEHVPAVGVCILFCLGRMDGACDEPFGDAHARLRWDAHATVNAT